MSAAMPRRVLAMLLVNYNRPVSMGSLIDELWESGPPRLARKTVQTYVYQIRRQLGDAGKTLIESRADGYVLRLAENELDLQQFDATVRHARAAMGDQDTAEALAMFREALGLWRGRALEDVEPGSALAARIEHIERQRTQAHAEAVDAAMKLGRYREVVDDLALLTREHPFHEGFHVQFMTALAGVGDRSRALDVFEGLRKRLGAELGLDPSDRLSDLHLALLTNAVRLAPGNTSSGRTRVLPAELPAVAVTPVGREDILTKLTGLRESRSKSPAVAVLTGQTGIGKTLLAVRAGHDLRADFPDGQLFARLGSGDPCTVLGSFLRSVGIAEHEIPPNLADRERLYRSSTADRRILVVLDDASDAAQVRPLLPAGSGCAVIVAARTRLAGLDGASVTTVGPLGPTEGVAMLASLLGADRVAREPETATRLVQLCEGLPLAIRAAAEKLLARPLWPIDELATRMEDPARRLQELVTGDHDPAERFEEAFHRFTPPYRWAFRRLVSLGTQPFTVEQSAAMLGVDSGSAECPLAELVAAHALMVVGIGEDGSTLFRFPELMRLHVLTHHDETRPPECLPTDVREWTGARIPAAAV
ncbi:DNA-binding transcriptional activator of the SARP family [Actinoalloteichus hymeniacidonis]|uniref:DNA-binding transcriptional activator of the SARP family n=1 Tax=Actinoalloteichus hymeniacidonis TaxID=340345 RepID=A0AAC9HMC6_9PSEU|nr:DNA-binding transcriptional activator of the SARP family [Actinoalloteichus hymeniacidonis]